MWEPIWLLMDWSGGRLVIQLFWFTPQKSGLLAGSRGPVATGRRWGIDWEMGHTVSNGPSVFADDRRVG